MMIRFAAWAAGALALFGCSALCWAGVAGGERPLLHASPKPIGTAGPAGRIHRNSGVLPRLEPRFGSGASLSRLPHPRLFGAFGRRPGGSFGVSPFQLRRRLAVVNGPLGWYGGSATAALLRRRWEHSLQTGPYGAGGSDGAPGLSSIPSVSTAPAYADVAPALADAGGPALDPAGQPGADRDSAGSLLFFDGGGGPQVIVVSARGTVRRSDSRRLGPVVYRFGVGSYD